MSAPQKIKIAARLRSKVANDEGIVDEELRVCRTTDSSFLPASGYISTYNASDPSDPLTFPFASCYGPDASQEDIFENDVEPLVDVVYSGVTVTIFAYGVTSSGKTFTMEGDKDGVKPGIIPRTVTALLQKRKEHPHLAIKLAMSYLEIYKDDVYDLLVIRAAAPKLPVRENGAGKVFVANLSEHDITSLLDFNRLYSGAKNQRSVATTNLNRESSRSHAVLTITVTMTDVTHNKTLIGKINLVDLAGSENNKQTGNNAVRMAESSSINKSLSALSQVVRDLNANKTRIPYRNSKLTRILQDALGGSSVGLLICNLAPLIKFRKDTLNTLRFASDAKNIENKVLVDEGTTHQSSTVDKAAPRSRSSTAFIHSSTTSKVLTGLNVGNTMVARGRPSMMPKSRYSRLSMYAGPGNGSNTSGPIAGIKENIVQSNSGTSSNGLSDKEIDERISKAVEAEVARRLAEREKEEDVRRRHESEKSSSSCHHLKSPHKDRSHELPSGVLTPLLQRHRDLDNELKSRLQELEKKYERGHKETQLAEVLSPVSRKKTGRAYVALAREHSEKGDLQVALDLYRKALSYVPNNQKLRERIIDIEYAVKNNTAFMASPKRPRKDRGKGKKKSQVLQLEQLFSDDQGDAEEVAMSLEQGLAMDLPRVTPGAPKRTREDREVVEEDETPSKRQKGVLVTDDDDAGEWDMLASREREVMV